MRTTLRTVLGVLLALSLALFFVVSCGDDDSATGDGSDDDPAAVLYGEWKTPRRGTTVAYGEDGTWSAQQDAYGAEPFDRGTFEFDGEVIVYSTDAGSMSCLEGETGVYEATITDAGELDLVKVEDPCAGRASDFAEGMIPASG